MPEPRDAAGEALVQDIVRTAQSAYRLGQAQDGFPLWQIFEVQIRLKLAAHTEDLTARLADAEGERDKWREDWRVTNDGLVRAQAAVKGLQHTLELWDQECGGKSPRELVELLTAAAHALRSYEFGNASPDLAKEVADRIDAALPAGTMLGQPITEAERQRISKDGP